MEKNISRGSIPQWATKSALLRNLSARASSANPKNIFTDPNQPPLLGSDCNQLGNMANNAKGSPKAIPKPAKPAVNGQAPDAADPANKVPNIGPVQENDTITKVSAMKNIPNKPAPCLEFVLFAIPLGSEISKKPKKDTAKTIKTTKKLMFNQILVEISLYTVGFTFPNT